MWRLIFQYPLHDGPCYSRVLISLTFSRLAGPPGSDSKPRTTLCAAYLASLAICTNCFWSTVISFHTSDAAHSSQPAQPAPKAHGNLRASTRVQRGESRVLSHNGHVPDVKKRPANVPEIGISARNNVRIVMKGLHLDRYQTLAGAQLCSHFAKSEASTASTTTIMRALQSGHSSAGWPSSTPFDNGRINIE
jgi:hypothetical protein